MNISAPFKGDRSKVKQVDPGKFLDTATGNYYTGTFENATNWGSDYNKIGQTDMPSPPTTSAPGAPPPTGLLNTRATNPGIQARSGPPTNPYGGLPDPLMPPPALPNNPYAPSDPSIRVPDRSSIGIQGNNGGQYNTTPLWMDSYTPPNPKESYFPDWYKANPTYTGPGSVPGGPQALKPPSDGNPMDQAYIRQWVNYYSQQPGVNPSTARDPEYWVRKISETGGWQGDNAGYWSGPQGMFRVEGAPEGGGGPRTTSGGYPGGTTSIGPRTLPGYTPLAPTQTGSAQEAVTYLNGISHSMGGGDLSQAELAQYAAMVGYKEGQPVTGDMVNRIAAAMMKAKGYGGASGGGGGTGSPGPTGTTPPGAGGTYTSNNPFDDPATRDYIDLLNSRIQDLLKPRVDPSLDAFMKMITDRAGALNTPYTNPDAAPLQDWMRKYFAQLQGPTYTPGQQDVIQTQALDPLERQRQQELKSVATVMASRGITPGSGPYLQMERDINQKFDAMRAQTQSGLAVNEINQGRQNQAQATNVGGQLASFTQGQFANNESRANDAVSLFGSIPQLNLAEFSTQQNRANQAVTLGKQIPDIAQQRMAQAISLLNGSNVNPAQLLQSLQGFQQQGINQNGADSAFWGNLIALIAKQFGL